MSETNIEEIVFSFKQPNARRNMPNMMDQVYWKQANTDNERLVLNS